MRAQPNTANTNMKTSTLLQKIILACLSTAVSATYDLRVTEIWPGQPSSDVTKDWFELSNFGDEPWVAATHGALYFVDGGDFDAADIAPVTDLTELAPKAIAIVVVDGDADDVTEFNAAWDGVLPESTVVGYVDDSPKFNQMADGVKLWITDTPPTMDDPDITALYSFTEELTNAASYLPETMTVSELGVDGAANSVTLGGSGGDVAAIASPGIFSFPDETCTGIFGLRFPLALKCWWPVVFKPLFEKIFGFFSSIF